MHVGWGMGMNWYFDEMAVIERIREMERQADRIQALGLNKYQRQGIWERFRMSLGRRLVALGKRLQQAESIGGPALSSPSQCPLK